MIEDLVADIREGLEETFDRLDRCAPFIPGYEDKDDAIDRARLLRRHGRGDSSIIRVRLTQCEPRICYRRLEKYAEEVQYQGKGLASSKGEVRIRILD